MCLLPQTLHLSRLHFSLSLQASFLHMKVYSPSITSLHHMVSMLQTKNSSQRNKEKGKYQRLMFSTVFKASFYTLLRKCIFSFFNCLHIFFNMKLLVVLLQNYVRLNIMAALETIFILYNFKKNSLHFISVLIKRVRIDITVCLQYIWSVYYIKASISYI